VARDNIALSREWYSEERADFQPHTSERKLGDATRMRKYETLQFSGSTIIAEKSAEIYCVRAEVSHSTTFLQLKHCSSPNATQINLIYITLYALEIKNIFKICHICTKHDVWPTERKVFRPNFSKLQFRWIYWRYSRTSTYRRIETYETKPCCMIMFLIDAWIVLKKK
jgi:hypothetical protein